MIFDAHVHIGTAWEPDALELAQDFAATNGYEKVVRPDGRLDRQAFLDLLAASEVDAVAVIGSRSGHNEYVLEFTGGDPRLVPVIVINPHLVLVPEKEIRSWYERGAKGLKFLPSYHHYYPNDVSLYPIYRVAEELGLPVTFHTGSSVFRNTRLKYSEPLWLDDVALDFPGLKILMAHCGRGFWYDEASFLARLHPNIYLELSGLPPAKLLTYLPNLEALADKAVFGTDWPACPGFSRNVQEFNKLPLSPEAKARILYHNAAAIFGLPAGKTSPPGE